MSTTEEDLIREYAHDLDVKLSDIQIFELGQELEQFASEYVYDEVKTRVQKLAGF